MVVPVRHAGCQCRPPRPGVGDGDAVRHFVISPPPRAGGHAWYDGGVRVVLSSCQLRPWRHTDLASLVRHANDKRVARTVRDLFPSPYTRADGERWLAHATAEGRSNNLAIDVDGAAVGGIGMIPGEDVQRIRAEVGYWLGHAYWGRGIMTEAVRAFSAHLLDERGFVRLEAPVFETNPASARVLEKAGYTLESRQRCAAIKDDRVIDILMYVRLADACARD